jgi:PAS domain S-box-containing protein
MNHDQFEGLARALFEESTEALILVNAETGEILDANAAAQRLSGFSPRSVIGTPVSELFRLSAKQWSITFPMPARTLNLPYSEWGGMLRTFQGATIPVDATFTRLSAKPHPVALVRICETAPTNGRHVGPSGGTRLKHLVATVADCLWSGEIVGRGDGQFKFLSPVVERIAGRSPAAIGKSLHSWREIIHPDDRHTWDEALQRRRAGKSTQDEYRVTWPDGSYRWVRDDARAVRAADGKSVSLYGVFTDVTGWRQAEESLHRLADLVDTAEDAIISQSAAGLIVDWNRGAERLYGYTKDEVKSKPVLRLFTEDGASTYSEIMRRMREGEPSRPYRTTQVRKTGETIEVSMRVSPIGGDEANGISIIARGING